MGKETERKFLVTSQIYQAKSIKTYYKQGYLSTDKERTVRIRIAEKKGYITIKGQTIKATRAEYEYEIPNKDAEEILDRLCLEPLIEKYRYTYKHTDGMIWEIDEFSGDNTGLIVAEIELPEENTVFIKPEWVGKEVTTDPRYYNSNLIHTPFSQWKDK